jgi:hypothetical protein
MQQQQQQAAKAKETTTMNADKADSNDNHRDKLRDGPCAKPYFDLEECAADKSVRSHRVSRRRRGCVDCGMAATCTLTRCCLQVLMLVSSTFSIITTF